MTDDDGFYGPGIIDPLDIIAKHEAMNQRLRARNALLELDIETLAKGQHLDELQRQLSIANETTKVAARESSKEIGKLTARIMELEAQAAIARGSLALPPQPDEPVTITHDVPPNAPR